MSHTKQVKDYYSILGVTSEASAQQIEEAYHSLSVQLHPKKHQKQTLSEHKKFKDVCEAYEVLGNQNRKSHYDSLIRTDFSLQQAQKTFEDFYNQFGIQNEEEKQFFEENHPHTLKNYYLVLGVTRNASLEQIQEAYRKLALKYHPKKNGQCQEAKHKFIQVNEAYNALACQLKRKAYNDIAFKSLQPIKAHDIFEEFFSDKPFKSTQDEGFFRPLMNNRWIRNLDKLMNDQHHQPIHQSNQTRRVHEVYQNKNGVETRKVVKERKHVKDGKVHSETIEEYCLPNGDKQVRKTITNGGNTEKNVYHLKKGDELPEGVLENGCPASKRLENGSHGSNKIANECSGGPSSKISHNESGEKVCSAETIGNGGSKSHQNEPIELEKATNA